MKRSLRLTALTLLVPVLAVSVTQAQDQGPAPFTFDKDAQVWYASTINAGSVEVCLKISDPARQMKLLRNGLEVWLDTKGKKNKKTGVLYPLPVAGRAPGQQAMQQQGQQTGNADKGRQDRQQAINSQLLEKRYMELKGFQEGINGQQDIISKTGVTVSLQVGEKDTLVYRLSVPLASFAAPVDPAKPFSIGIVIKGMQMPDQGQGGGFGGDDGPGGGGPGGPGGGGGFGGGNMPPPGGGMGAGGRGEGGPDMQDMQSLFKDDTIWIKLRAK